MVKLSCNDSDTRVITYYYNNLNLSFGFADIALENLFTKWNFYWLKVSRFEIIIYAYEP